MMYSEECWGKNIFRIFFFCSLEERKKYTFEITRGSANDGRMYISVIHFKEKFIENRQKLSQESGIQRMT